MQHSADRSAGNPPRLRGAGVLRHACFALIPLAALGLAGCLPVRSAQSFAEQTPEMRPETFFAGSLHSWGVLETRSGAPSATFRVVLLRHKRVWRRGIFCLITAWTSVKLGDQGDGEPPSERSDRCRHVPLGSDWRSRGVGNLREGQRLGGPGLGMELRGESSPEG